MQDNSFEQALEVLHEHIVQDIRDNVKQRIPLLTGRTAESLVGTIENPTMRESVLEILRLIKIVAYLETMMVQGIMSKAELQELRTALYKAWEVGKNDGA